MPEECRPRNQFHARIPYLRARRNRRFELIVDEPLARPFYPVSRVSSHEITNYFGKGRTVDVEPRDSDKTGGQLERWFEG